MFLHELQIGNIKLKNNILLAPMAGITDLPFRVICRDFGAGLATSEMVSAKGLFYDDKKTEQLMKFGGEAKPHVVQIFGSDVESMSYAANYVSKVADIIDINMGCPAPKVVKNGDGSKLLLELDKAKEIMEAVVKNSNVPVTLKFRKGWDYDHIVATDVAKIAEEVGISMITIHGRTRTDYYSGKVDLDIIKKVKEAVTIPVIGNGDIVDEESARIMFEETGVDGIMIGRASLGNPWIFENIIHYLKTGEKLPEKMPSIKKEIIKKHLMEEIKEKGEITAIHEFRKHISAYSKSLPNSSEFRSKINMIEKKEELIQSIEEFFVDKI